MDETIPTLYWTAGGTDAVGSLGATLSPTTCLLVLLPGIGDSDSAFEEHGFVEEARQADLECDLALVDAHFTYYLTQSVVERVSTDVLHEARRRGYRSVWLVGISLGGYGAMLTANAHPELVDGVVLLAPMVGVPPREDGLVREVIAAGGLHLWPGVEDNAPAPRHHFREPRIVWDWLRDTTLDPARTGRVVLGFGTEDHRADRYEIIAQALPAGTVMRAAGTHDWQTWRRLWRQLLERQPWNEVAAEERIRRASFERGGPRRL